MSAGRRKHEPAFKAKVALAAQLSLRYARRQRRTVLAEIADLRRCCFRHRIFDRRLNHWTVPSFSS